MIVCKKKLREQGITITMSIKGDFSPLFVKKLKAEGWRCKECTKYFAT